MAVRNIVAATRISVKLKGENGKSGKTLSVSRVNSGSSDEKCADAGNALAALSGSEAETVSRIDTCMLAGE